MEHARLSHTRSMLFCLTSHLFDFKSCFLSLFLEDCFWVAGESRVLLEHFMGMKHAAFKVQLFGLPEVHQIWKREQSHRSGSALVSNGLDCWTSKTSKLRPRSITWEACFNLKETSSVERRLQRKAGFHPEVLESPCFCSCIRVQGWMAHPPSPYIIYIYVIHATKMLDCVRLFQLTRQKRCGWTVVKMRVEIWGIWWLKFDTIGNSK